MKPFLRITTHYSCEHVIANKDLILKIARFISSLHNSFTILFTSATIIDDIQINDFYDNWLSLCCGG